MTFLQWLLSTGATASVLAITGYLLRELILTKLAAKIKHQYDEDLARLRSKLSQGEFRYSLVFKETADTIVKTYQKLLELHAASVNFTNDWSDENRRTQLSTELNNKAEAFRAYYAPNQIYIPKKT